jgi:hypothetical protein
MYVCMYMYRHTNYNLGKYLATFVHTYPLGTVSCTITIRSVSVEAYKRHITDESLVGVKKPDSIC